MRIVLATDTYFPHVNGASYSVQRLAHALAAAGHDVHVIAPSQSLDQTKEHTGSVITHGISSIPIVFYEGFRITVRPIAAWQVRSILAEIQPDIIHMHMHFAIASSALAYARSNGVPVIATNHFMPENLIHYIHLPDRIKQMLIRFAWRDAARVYKKATIVVSPTHTARTLLEQFMDRKSEVVSNGVPLRHFHSNHDTAAVREKYKLGFSPILLSVSRLDAEKNIDRILHAVARTKTHFTYIVAGKGVERDTLEALASDLGISNRVSFIGFVEDEDLPALYAAADCFINAGTAELQGMSVMEAMATGLPILAAQAVALPELVLNGVNGYLFNPTDHARLATLLDCMFRNPGTMRVMGQKSTDIIQPHSIRNMVNAYEHLYSHARKLMYPQPA